VEPDGLEIRAPTFSACCPQKEQRVFAWFVRFSFMVFVITS